MSPVLLVFTFPLWSLIIRSGVQFHACVRFFGSCYLYLRITTGIQFHDAYVRHFATFCLYFASSNLEYNFMMLLRDNLFCTQHAYL